MVHEARHNTKITESCSLQMHREIVVPVEVVGSLEHMQIPDVMHTMRKIRKTALRVSPERSFEILKFFAEKIVAQIS